MSFTYHSHFFYSLLIHNFYQCICRKYIISKPLMELFCITHIAKQTINKTLQHLQEVLSPLGKIIGRNYRFINSQNEKI